MIKTSLLALTILTALPAQSQARPNPIWPFLGGLALGSALGNQPFYYAEQPRYYYSERPRYYYSEPPAVYYPPVVRYYRAPRQTIIGYDCYGNQYVQPRRW